MPESSPEKRPAALRRTRENPGGGSSAPRRMTTPVTGRASLCAHAIATAAGSRDDRGSPPGARASRGEGSLRSWGSSARGATMPPWCAAWSTSRQASCTCVSPQRHSEGSRSRGGSRSQRAQRDVDGVGKTTRAGKTAAATATPRRLGQRGAPSKPPLDSRESVPLRAMPEALAHSLVKCALVRGARRAGRCVGDSTEGAQPCRLNVSIPRHGTAAPGHTTAWVVADAVVAAATDRGTRSEPPARCRCRQSWRSDLHAPAAHVALRSGSGRRADTAMAAAG